jgi:D-tyrosyl-tRNA(Tyr) deacylase
MRAVIQRVRHAKVTVDGEVTGEIGPGLLILLGVKDGDAEKDGAWLAAKIANLRIFADDSGKMNESLLDMRGGALVVSQFTLYGDCRKGRRPSFVGAAHPSIAEPLYERFCAQIEAQGVVHVGRGVFGAMMDVELLNDGPVTLTIDSP